MNHGQSRICNTCLDAAHVRTEHANSFGELFLGDFALDPEFLDPLAEALTVVQPHPGMLGLVH